MAIALTSTINKFELALPIATLAELCKLAIAKFAAETAFTELPERATSALEAETEACWIAADALIDACCTAWSAVASICSIEREATTLRDLTAAAMALEQSAEF